MEEIDFTKSLGGYHFVDDEDFEMFVYEFMNDDYPKNRKESFNMYFRYIEPPYEESYDSKIYEGTYKIIPLDFGGELGYEIEKICDYKLGG